MLACRVLLRGRKDVKHRELAHVERNVDALLQNLVTGCQKIFDEASKATARSAVLVAGSVNTVPAATTEADAEAVAAAGKEEGPRSASAAPLIRERTVLGGSEASDSHFSTCLVRWLSGSTTGGQFYAVPCNQASA